MSLRLRCLLALMLCCAALPAPAAEPAHDRHVILISLDGLPAYLRDDPSAPLATLRELMQNGAAAEGMIPSNPSVTWPNHTSLLSGVRPEKHGVLFNGVLERPGLGLPVAVNPRKSKSELVHAQTLDEVLHAAGLSVAGINWPCTSGAPTIALDFPDAPDTFTNSTPAFIQELTDAGILTETIVKDFLKMSPAARDRVWTQAACHAIRAHKPNLVLFHPLNVDAVHHKYGPQSMAGYSAVAYSDSCVREICRAVEDAGIAERTTIFVVSDHGFISIPKTLKPNVELRKAGLLTVEGTRVTSARVHVVPEGGIAMVYLTVPDSAAEDRRRVIELFTGQEGIKGIVLPDEFPRYGLPSPDEYEQMADLVLVAEDGYGFNGAADGETLVVESTTSIGTHGFLSTNPKMLATFIASGAGIRPGARLETIENIDVAPTIARLLGVTLAGADGRVLDEILLPAK